MSVEFMRCSVRYFNAVAILDAVVAILLYLHVYIVSRYAGWFIPFETSSC